VSRDAIYRVSVLSASIVAFSATLLSIKQLHLSVNESLLAASWCLFAAVVVIGPTSVAVEARARYVITWRSRQPQDFDAERKLTRLERLQLLGVLSTAWPFDREASSMLATLTTTRRSPRRACG
jgi:hypothetical protein